MPPASPLDSRHPSHEASPLEQAIGNDAVERYERALSRLRPEDRAAIVARVEMDCTNEEIAAALNKPSANAARMAVATGKTITQIWALENFLPAN